MDDFTAASDIRHFAGVFARPGIEADDLAQEARLAVLRASTRYDPGRGASLRTYARYRVIGSIRSAVRAEAIRQEREVPHEPEMGSKQESRDNFGESGIMLTVFHRELTVLLDRAIATLTPKQRVVIAMRYKQGRAFSEIATALGVGCSTAWNYHEQALNKLREVLTTFGLGPFAS